MNPRTSLEAFSLFKGAIHLFQRLTRWESKERNTICCKILCLYSFGGIAQEKYDFSVAETLERLVPCITVQRVPRVQKGPHLHVFNK